MELRHLRHFVAVAEELHFGRAARRLRMAQPPLSQSIQRLEESLGAKLLDRSSREVHLTPAGAALLAEARGILERSEAAEIAVKRAASQTSSVISVGFVPMTTTPALPRAIREFRRRWPRVEVELHEQTSVTQLKNLRRGDLDLGLIVGGHDVEGFIVESIGSFGPVAVIPKQWPLARRRTVRLGDLKNMPLVLFPQQLKAPYFSELSSACRRAGFVPKVAQRVGQPYTMLSLVAQEMGIGFVPAAAHHVAVEGVSFVPLSDLPASFDTHVSMAWVDRELPPHLVDLIALIRRLTLA